MLPVYWRSEIGNGGLRWRKRAQTTLDASFGLLVSFFFSFLHFLLTLTTLLGANNLLEVRNRQRRAVTTKTGPNDVSASFGPLVSFLFISFSFLLSLTTVIGATSVLEVRNRQRRAAMKTKGPNDASSVVWARFRHHTPPLPILDLQYTGST